MSDPNNKTPNSGYILNDRKSVVRVENWVSFRGLSNWPAMQMAIALIYGLFVVLLGLTASLYPEAGGWVILAIAFSLWFAALSLIVVWTTKPLTAKLTATTLNGLATLASCGFLVGCRYGLKWCLIPAVGIALFCGIITLLIVKFYPPDPPN